MRSRTITDNGVIVWFGSLGKNEDGTAIKADSFSDKQEGVKSSLLQKLSVFKNELWYQYGFGLPLFDKVKHKTILDLYVLDIISNTHDVVSINKFISKIEGRRYTCDIDIVTNFGNVEIII